MRPARASSSSAELASARRFRSSAVSGSMCSSEAMASVISLPPVMSMRTNRGTPRSCTTTLVTPPPTQTIASLVGSVVAEGDPGVGQGADERERDHVDERRREAGPVDRRQQRAHHVALRRDQQDPHHRLLVGPHELLEDLEVEDGLVDRDGDELLNLVAQRRPQVLLRHGGKVGLAHDHPLVGHPDDDVAALEPDFAPEAPDGGGDRRRVDDLAVADRAEGQRHLAEAVQGGLITTPERHLGGTHRVGADVEADAAHRHQPIPRLR